MSSSSIRVVLPGCHVTLPARNMSRDQGHVATGAPIAETGMNLQPLFPVDHGVSSWVLALLVALGLCSLQARGECRLAATPPELLDPG